MRYALLLIVVLVLTGCGRVPSITDPTAPPAPGGVEIEPTFELPTAETVTIPNPGSFDKLSDRELQRVVRGPDRFDGRGFQLWACIWQFDAATGEGSFLAYISHRNEDAWFTADNAWFLGEPNALVDVAAGDIVKINAVVMGAYTYDTTTGGFSTVPQFGVLKIDRQRGSCD